VVCLIFDEVHERSLQSEFGLALALEIRGALRPDLRLLAMSATLDAGPLAELMGASVVTAEGRAFPVETRHLEVPAKGRFEADAAALTGRALAETDGGVLVFLPGEGEIRRVAGLLDPGSGVTVQPLYGAMPLAAQRAALRPLEGARKLVLATAIAETSLTIPDVRVVVDCGRARRALYDPGSGMTRLVTERVTRAEAEQRRGRAGRVAPGVCYRMWTKGEEGGLAAFPPPEIVAADLTGLALELALWGGDALPFRTPPPEAALAEARALLADLGALDGAGRITAHGRRIAALPLHPRIAHMLVAGGGGPAAAGLAALLEARDPLRGDCDLGRRLAALRDPAEAPPEARGALAAIREEARRLARLVPGDGGVSAAGLVSLAYPDRIGLRRPGDTPRWLLSGGKGTAMDPADALVGQRLLAVAGTDGDPREARIRLAVPIAESELRALHGDRLHEVLVCEWSRRERAVVARERLMLGAVALEDRHWRDVPPDVLGAAMAEGVRDLGLQALPWTKAAEGLRARVEYLRGEGAEMPDMSDERLMAGLGVWLEPWLSGMRRASELDRLDMLAALEGMLDRDQRQRLDREAPAAITAPTGTRLPVDWSGEAPMVSVRLQEMFGTTQHPVVGPARRPLLIALLSPAGRPVQLTADLPGFWVRSYADVRKDLRGRYPRHPWPEDPTQAEPTRRVKPRGT
jgi:ATP-dependent helicase HrpB